MTLIAFLAVAFAAFLLGCIATVYLAVWLEDRITVSFNKAAAKDEKIESSSILTY